MTLLDSALQTMHHVNDFYQSAWEKLIFTITLTSIALGALITFIGIIMPLWLQTLQKENFKEERENYKLVLKAETDPKIKKLDDRLEAFMKSLTEEKEVLQKEHDKQLKISRAHSFLLQGQIRVNSNEYWIAIPNFLISVGLAIQGEDYLNAISAIRNVIFSSSKDVTKELIEKALKVLSGKTLQEYLDKIDEESKKLDAKIVVEKELLDKIKEMKEAIGKIKDK